jgi:sugar phosphate isomerase/epimerase
MILARAARRSGRPVAPDGGPGGSRGTSSQSSGFAGKAGAGRASDGNGGDMMDLSYQLYSSRKSPSLARSLRMLAKIGYRQVEGYPALLADPARLDSLRSNLTATGLAMPTAQFPLETVEGAPGRILEIADALGIRKIYCPTLPADARTDTAAGYEALGRRLQKASEPLRASGLGFGWRNHGHAFERLADGRVPLAALFEGGPDLEWDADFAWAVSGGADPFRWIDACAERITAVHVKDLAPVGQALDEGGWCDIGAGRVPWPALMAALRKTRAAYFVVEHDGPSDDLRFAERSFFTVRGLRSGFG